MRVTNSMLVSNFMNDLNTNMNKLSSLQSQMASGKKYAHISDDPISVIYSQQARYKLNQLSHYQANVESARNWLTQSEASMMEIQDVIVAAYESCIDAATNVKTDEDRANLASYVGQMRDHVLLTLNATFGNKYVFGGYNTTGYSDGSSQITPFTVNDDGNLCFNGVDLTSTDPDDLALIEKMRQDVLTFDIAIGSEMPVSVNGIDLAFYGTADDGSGGTVNLNIYNLLDDLYNSLINGDDVTELQPYITQLQNAENHILATVADLGGRQNRLDILDSRYEQDYINYTSMLSDAEDIDMAEAIMNYKMAEAVYKAALSTGAYIIQPTLMDFLK